VAKAREVAQQLAASQNGGGEVTDLTETMPAPDTVKTFMVHRLPSHGQLALVGVMYVSGTTPTQSTKW